MKKSMKIWFIVAGSLVLAGIIAFVGGIAMLNWNFTQLGNPSNNSITNTHEINEIFSDISINTKEADVTFILAEKSRCKVVCEESEKLNHIVEVKNGALTINSNDARKWYDHISFIGFNSPKVYVYLPNSEYGALSINSSTGDLEISRGFKFESIDVNTSTGEVTNNSSAAKHIKIKTSTGKVCVEDVFAGVLDITVTTGKVTVGSIGCGGNISINVSTGRVNISDVSCQAFSTTGSTGDISIENLLAEEKISIERSTGDVRLEMCDAAELLIKTDTGDVRGSLLSPKVFATQTDTGNISVPKSTTGGLCDITTDTGDITFTICEN